MLAPRKTVMSSLLLYHQSTSSSTAVFCRVKVYLKKKAEHKAGPIGVKDIFRILTLILR